MNLMVIWTFLIVVECNNRWYYPIHSKAFKMKHKEQPFVKRMIPQIVEPTELGVNKLVIPSGSGKFNYEESPEPHLEGIYSIYNKNIRKGNSLITKVSKVSTDRIKREAHLDSAVSAKPININREAVEFIDINKELPDIDELGALNKLPVENTSKPEMQHRTDTLLMSNRDFSNKAFQESRGITKEQWIKQPYPVHSAKVDDTYHDSTVLSSNSRAPSVRFVTQTRLDREADPATRFYEREGRVRDLSRNISPRDSPAPREPQENIRSRNAGRQDRDFYENYDNLYLPYFRNLYLSDHPYYRYQESRYEPRYRPSSNIERSEYTNRQRRIIYYATLPEVVRTPPNVNLRERYNFRDAHDNRYAPVREDGLYSADRFPLVKYMHYTDMERTKLPYTTKVSTDVNVQAAKKNPEKRTYSEPDRTRYVYNTYAAKGL